MKSLSLMTAAAAFLLFAGRAQASATENFKLIHVADSVADLQSGHPMVVDANSHQTRQKDGVIPGAKLLPARGLRRRKEMRRTTSRPTWSSTAPTPSAWPGTRRPGGPRSAGYAHVSVLADGIQGWKAAGQKTAQP